MSEKLIYPESYTCLKAISELTGRNVISYYIVSDSDGTAARYTSTSPKDMHGFIQVLNGKVIDKTNRDMADEQVLDRLSEWKQLAKDDPKSFQNDPIIQRALHILKLGTFYSFLDSQKLHSHLTKEWLETYMFHDEEPEMAADKASKAAGKLLFSARRKNNSPRSYQDCLSFGLKVKAYDADPDLLKQLMDLLSAHKKLFQVTGYSKCIENHNGSQFFL